MLHTDIFKEEAGTRNNITTANIKSDEDQAIIDAAITTETKRRVALVDDAKNYDVLTASWIDGEFVTVSNYELSDEMIKDLEIKGDQSNR